MEGGEDEGAQRMETDEGQQRTKRSPRMKRTAAERLSVTECVSSGVCVVGWLGPSQCAGMWVAAWTNWTASELRRLRMLLSFSSLLSLPASVAPSSLLLPTATFNCAGSARRSHTRHTCCS